MADRDTIVAQGIVSGLWCETNKIALLRYIAQLTFEASQSGGGGGGGVWGAITGTLTNQADLVAALNAAAISARPLTGVGSPVGAVVPAYIGQLYTDSAAQAFYQATGLTNADWIQRS